MQFKSKSLTPEALSVMRDKETESAFSGHYENCFLKGTYLCRQCGKPLFRSETKFHSGCGWPSFDDEIIGAIKRVPDQDGFRIEILCARCEGHLGHVFEGEGFTSKNTRYCVNAISLDFVNNMEVSETEEAILAAGCFWGVEENFKKMPGILGVEVGYTGGEKKYPTYNEVCSGATGHVEAVRVIYDVEKINYEQVIRYFFSIHNACQVNGQGPDTGLQYASVIFYYDNKQKEIAEKYILKLKKEGQAIATKLLPVKLFWRAEEYHQGYYDKK